jgi:ABC-type phosphate transport system permease subunit
MVYYALAMSAGNLGGNRFVSFSLSGLVEVPSLVIGYLIIDK